MMRFLKLTASFLSSTLLFHDQTRVGAIDLGNEISAAVGRTLRKLKPFSWNYLINVTKSVLVLGKAIYDPSISDAIRFFLDGHRSR